MDLENMSDEELMKISSPPQDVSPPIQEENTDVEPVEKTQPEFVEEVSTNSNTSNTSDSTTTGVEKEVNVVEEVLSSGSKEESSDIDYKAKYEELMTSFKANGKNVELKSPDEARQLMQMGANFTKKMQEIAPYRKIIAMLQNNNLLDEGKLSYLIDLDKKNPDAIQHLVKDANLDPLDIDTTEESKYSPASYAVSENEILFKETLDELTTDPEGQTTVQLFNQWDTESKSKLWEHPELMKIIHRQRESGLYDKIVGEIDRLKTFGQIPSNVSFIEAYTRIGNELQARTQTQVATPVARKAAVPRSQVTNNQAVRSASVSRVNKPVSSDTQKLVNLSDEDFMKQFAQYNNRI